MRVTRVRVRGRPHPSTLYIRNLLNWVLYRQSAVVVLLDEGDSGSVRGRNDKRKKWQASNVKRKAQKERCERQKG
jgi:hypothetical protein